MFAILDYNIGNVRSVHKAMERAIADIGSDHQVILTDDPEIILSADGVVLPGVGAFGACITNLVRSGLAPVVADVVSNNIPLLGICVGMQMLFEGSEEMGDWQGLGLLQGYVRRFDDTLRVPQIGWNQLTIRRSDPLFQGLHDGVYAYFVHSYYCDAAEAGDVLASTNYGIDYPSVVQRDRIWGIQCHPEKSQQVGLRILGNFVGLCGAADSPSTPITDLSIAER